MLCNKKPNEKDKKVDECDKHFNNEIKEEFENNDNEKDKQEEKEINDFDNDYTKEDEEEKEERRTIYDIWINLLENFIISISTSKDLNPNKLTKHHLFPRSRCIDKENIRNEDNIKMIQYKYHIAWHMLFQNMTPFEVIIQIVQFWTPKKYLKKIYLEVEWEDQTFCYSFPKGLEVTINEKKDLKEELKTNNPVKSSSEDE